jgi:glycine C-acetyltransferase
MLGDARLAA